MSNQTAPATDRTLDELKALLSEAEQALAATGDAASDEMTALRHRLRDALAESKATARHALDLAKEKAAKADQAIHTHPYIAIGIAAGVGLLLGALVARNRDSR